MRISDWSSDVCSSDLTPTAAENAAAEQAQALPPLPEEGVARLLGLANAAKEPLRAFLIQHSSNAERAFFLRSAQRLLPPSQRGEIDAEHFLVVVPAFTVSEDRKSTRLNSSH